MRSTDPRDSVFYDETEHILEDAAGSDLGEKRGAKREREDREEREDERHPYYCVVLCAVCCVLCSTSNSKTPFFLSRHSFPSFPSFTPQRESREQRDGPLQSQHPRRRDEVSLRLRRMAPAKLRPIRAAWAQEHHVDGAGTRTHLPQAPAEGRKVRCCCF